MQGWPSYAGAPGLRQQGGAESASTPPWPLPPPGGVPALRGDDVMSVGLYGGDAILSMQMLEDVVGLLDPDLKLTETEVCRAV